MNIGIVTHIILKKLEISLDRDGSFHYLPVGEQKVGRIVPPNDLKILVKCGVVNYNEGRDRKDRITASNVLIYMKAMQVMARR